MIELREGALHFSFPEVHRDARLVIEFQRTLRVPDDGEARPFPTGLGLFPLRHVDDYAEAAPPPWIVGGGVVMPMYRSEALWLRFRPKAVDRIWRPYPYAIKVAVGGRDAATGNAWSSGLHETPQDYMVVPAQHWLDGYRAADGTARQLTVPAAAWDPMVEENLSRDAEHGGLRIVVHPMRWEVFKRRFPDYELRPSPLDAFEVTARGLDRRSPPLASSPGEHFGEWIRDDPFAFENWDQENGSGCHIHVANSLVWEAVTGSKPPTPPPTEDQYAEAGLPWLEAYDEESGEADRETRLAEIRGSIRNAWDKDDVPLPGDLRPKPTRILGIWSKPSDDVVREGPS